MALGHLKRLQIASYPQLKKTTLTIYDLAVNVSFIDINLKEEKGIMKRKMNQKGVGHHVLLIAVAVIAVVSAAGYFVWDRQKSDEIVASAASIPFLAPSRANSGATKFIRMSACKNPPKSGKGVNISFAGTRPNANASTGFKIMRGSSTWGIFNFPATLPPGPDINTIYPGGGPGRRPMTNVLPNERITISYSTSNIGDAPYGTYTTANIANCPR